MKKRIIGLFLIFAMLFPCVSALALTEEEAPPGEEVLLRYEDFSRILPVLSVSGSTAEYKLTIVGASDVTSISVTYQLQQLSSSGTYSNYGSSWTASSDSRTLYDSGTKSVASGETYRLKVTVTPYINGVKGTSETVYS